MRHGSRRALGVVLVSALVVLAGCSGAANGGGEASQLAAETQAGGGGDGASAQQDGGSSDDAFQVRERQIVMTGEVSLRVDDYAGARRNLTATAEDLGGFVSDSSRRRHEVAGGSYVTGSVTLRVPREEFDAMMDRAEAAGTVRSSTTQSKDVTDQVVDVEARLRNLRTQRDRLRTLYEQANDTESVLEVQKRLSETQERIERLEAERRSLERRVSYSTVRVELGEERPESAPEAVRNWYDAPLVGAFLESVDGVVVVARAAAVLAAYALPYLLVFGVPPLLLGAVAYRRWRGGDGADGSPDGGAAGTSDGDDVPDDGGDGDGAPADGEDAAGTPADESVDGSADGGTREGADDGGEADRSDDGGTGGAA